MSSAPFEALQPRSERRGLKPRPHPFNKKYKIQNEGYWSWVVAGRKTAVVLRPASRCSNGARLASRGEYGEGGSGHLNRQGGNRYLALGRDWWQLGIDRKTPLLNLMATNNYYSINAHGAERGPSPDNEGYGPPHTRQSSVVYDERVSAPMAQLMVPLYEEGWCYRYLFSGRAELGKYPQATRVLVALDGDRPPPWRFGVTVGANRVHITPTLAPLGLTRDEVVAILKARGNAAVGGERDPSEDPNDEWPEGWCYQALFDCEVDLGRYPTGRQILESQEAGAAMDRCSNKFVYVRDTDGVTHISAERFSGCRLMMVSGVRRDMARDPTMVYGGFWSLDFWWVVSYFAALTGVTWFAGRWQAWHLRRTLPPPRMARALLVLRDRGESGLFDDASDGVHWKPPDVRPSRTVR